jgi:hypothetical protein
MKDIRWQLCLGLGLVFLSVVLYGLHYVAFRDAHHIFIYLLGDIAFVPIEVLLVTLIIHRVLSAREKAAVLQKMNMVIGTFFSEMGTDFMKRVSALDTQLGRIQNALVIKGDWTDERFEEVAGSVRNHNSEIQFTPEELAALKYTLSAKRESILRLLENPNLLEHDSFTDLLWATTHLAEELACRPRLNELSEKDRNHLAGDVKRVYGHLLSEWLDYMQHLKRGYPYLFSLAMRTNPFDAHATVEIR